MAVKATVALFQPVRVPRNFKVDQAMTVPLEVNAFACRIGGDEYADRGIFGVELESRLDSLPVDRILRSVEEFQPVTFFEAAYGQLVVKPLLGVSIFGENNDAFVAPAATGTDDRTEPVDQIYAPGLAVELGGGALRPRGQIVQDFVFRIWRAARNAPSRCFQCFRLGFLLLVLSSAKSSSACVKDPCEQPRWTG